jgi:hypothetical protein
MAPSGDDRRWSEGDLPIRLQSGWLPWRILWWAGLPFLAVLFGIVGWNSISEGASDKSVFLLPLSAVILIAWLIASLRGHNRSEVLITRHSIEVKRGKDVSTDKLSECSEFTVSGPNIHWTTSAVETGLGRTLSGFHFGLSRPEISQLAELLNQFRKGP